MVLGAHDPVPPPPTRDTTPDARPDATPDTTMVSPAHDADATMVSSASDELPPTQRLSRQAVESLLAKSNAANPQLQKTQPGSDPVPTSSSSSAIEGLLPPTREMPRLPVSPPLQPSARDLAASKPGFTLEDVMRSAASKSAPPSSSPSSRDAEQTVIMTDTEKAAAAKLRPPDRSAAKVAAAPPVPRPASIPPPSRSVSKPATSSVQDLRAQAAPRPSMLPKVLAAAAALLVLMGAAGAALYFGSGSHSSAADVEKWNELPVFPESDVEKTPFPLVFSELPKVKLEPGRVVSVTVSWIVTPEGLVDDPKIVASASPEIDAVVVEAVRKWRYEPGVKDGRTVPVRVLRKYTFPQGGGS